MRTLKLAAFMSFTPDMWAGVVSIFLTLITVLLIIQSCQEMTLGEVRVLHFAISGIGHLHFLALSV